MLQPVYSNWLNPMLEPIGEYETFYIPPLTRGFAHLTVGLLESQVGLHPYHPHSSHQRWPGNRRPPEFEITTDRGRFCNENTAWHHSVQTHLFSTDRFPPLADRRQGRSRNHSLGQCAKAVNSHLQYQGAIHPSGKGNNHGPQVFQNLLQMLVFIV